MDQRPPANKYSESEAGGRIGTLKTVKALKIPNGLLVLFINPSSYDLMIFVEKE